MTLGIFDIFLDCCSCPLLAYYGTIWMGAVLCPGIPTIWLISWTALRMYIGVPLPCRSVFSWRSFLAIGDLDFF
jgi:hypothetical protein